MSGYYPDPPFQIYWPDEPPVVYRADPTAPSYFADAPSRDYYPDESVQDKGEESVIDSAIRNMPVLGPVSHLPAPRRATPAPQASQSPAPGKPNLHLVPPVPSPRAGKSSTGPSVTGPSIIDRRVTLIEMENLLDMFLEADDSDGYTRGELMPEVEAIERKMRLVRKRVRGTLLERVSNWMRTDK